MLAFALVHVELDGVAVGAVKSFVAIEDDLHEIIAGWNVVEMANGITEGRVVDGDGLARLELVDVEAEDHLRLGREVDLHARLGAGVVGEEE